MTIQSSFPKQLSFEENDWMFSQEKLDTRPLNLGTTPTDANDNDEIDIYCYESEGEEAVDHLSYECFDLEQHFKPAKTIAKRELPPPDNETASSHRRRQLDYDNYINEAKRFKDLVPFLAWVRSECGADCFREYLAFIETLRAFQYYRIDAPMLCSAAALLFESKRKHVFIAIIHALPTIWKELRSMFNTVDLYLTSATIPEYQKKLEQVKSAMDLLRLAKRRLRENSAAFLSLLKLLDSLGHEDTTINKLFISLYEIVEILRDFPDVLAALQTYLPRSLSIVFVQPDHEKGHPILSPKGLYKGRSATLDHHSIFRLLCTGDGVLPTKKPDLSLFGDDDRPEIGGLVGVPMENLRQHRNGPVTRSLSGLLDAPLPAPEDTAESSGFQEECDPEQEPYQFDENEQDEEEENNENIQLVMELYFGPKLFKDDTIQHSYHNQTNHNHPHSSSSYSSQSMQQTLQPTPLQPRLLFSSSANIPSIAGNTHAQPRLGGMVGSAPSTTTLGLPLNNTATWPAATTLPTSSFPSTSMTGFTSITRTIPTELGKGPLFEEVKKWLSSSQ